MASTKSSEGAWRQGAYCWPLNSPTARPANLLPKADVDLLNRLDGADALSNIGLRGGYAQVLVYLGLVATASFATRSALVQLRMLSPLADAMCRQWSCTGCTVLCAA